MDLETERRSARAGAAGAATREGQGERPSPARASAPANASRPPQRRPGRPWPRRRLGVPLAVATACARIARRASRAIARGGGTTLPGRVLLALRPDALEALGRRLDGGAVLVSATNGKTTTTAMIAQILRAQGRPVVHNQAGSNLAWGVATALLDARPGDGQVGLFEVDEAWLGAVARALRPRIVVLANLFRDQLDRYGELERLADEWAALAHELVEWGTKLVLCADDPLVADVAPTPQAALYFGLEDDARALPHRDHAADATHCRRCGAPYEYTVSWLGHLGRYCCPACGHGRPEPTVAARRVELRGMRGSLVEIEHNEQRARIELPLPGVYNAYNALAACAAAIALGFGLRDAATALADVQAAFGRVEVVTLEGRELVLMLIKNPVGANEVLRTLVLEDQQLCLWIALNDGIADGRDVSWIWDAEFELLRGRVRFASCSGTRAPEMALRLKYAGVEAPLAVNREVAKSLEQALRHTDGRLYALPTYTALLELRTWLARKGAAKHWADR